MIKLNYNDLSKQAKIRYNALFNVVLNAKVNGATNGQLNSFTIPLCLSTDNKVNLTEKNFIFFESVLDELKIFGDYSIVKNNGRAVDEIKTDYSTVIIYWSTSEKIFSEFKKQCISQNSNFVHFDFSEVDTSKLLKRDGKAEKAKTAENKEKKAEEQKTAEDTNKKLEEKTAEVQKLKKEVAEKNEQLNKKQIDKFNDEALISIANCIEFLIKKHCPIPQEFEFAAFETDLFKVISAHWDLKILDK